MCRSTTATNSSIIRLRAQAWSAPAPARALQRLNVNMAAESIDRHQARVRLHLALADSCFPVSGRLQIKQCQYGEGARNGSYKLVRFIYSERVRLQPPAPRPPT